MAPRDNPGMRGAAAGRPAGPRGKADPSRLVTSYINTPVGPRLCLLADPLPGGGPGRPVVLGFHGGGGNAMRFAARSGMVEALYAFDQRSIYPQASSHWADGRDATDGTWEDDRFLIDTMLRRTAPSPVAAVGVSNGGIFALRLACEFASRLSAVASVSAGLPVDFVARAPVGPPVPIMLVQATDDPIIPFQGGNIPLASGMTMGGRLLSANETAAFFCDRNRCTGSPRQKLASIGAVPVEISVWTPSAGGAEVWQVVMRTPTHGWLGRPPGTGLRGSLEELVARFLLWHTDPTCLIIEPTAAKA